MRAFISCVLQNQPQPAASAILRVVVSSCSLLFIALLFAGCAARSGTGDGASEVTFQQAMLQEQLSRGGSIQQESKDADSQYHFLLGEVSLQKDDFDQAFAEFEIAASKASGSAPYLRKRLAQLYLKKNQPELALEQIGRALQGSPDDTELLAIRASIYASQQKFPEAVAAYKDLITRDPKTYDYYILLSTLYAQQENFPAAIETLNILIKADPDSIFGIYYLGRVYEMSGNIKEAERYYRRATELNPDAESLQLDFARTLALQDKSSDAIAVCKRLLERNPRNIQARAILSQLLWESKNYSEALTQLEELAKTEEDPTETRLRIGLLKIEMKDYQGAVAHLSAMVEANPANTPARYFLASGYAGLGQLDKAIGELKQISVGQKMFIESRTFAAYLLRQDKRFAEALPFVDEALSQKPDDPTLLAYKLSLEREADLLPAAVATANKLLAIEPDKSQHHFLLGTLLEESSDRAGAISAMKKAIELDPKNANALNYLGYSLAEDGKSLEDAERLIKRALEIEPNNGYFIDSLGWTYYKMGRYREAQKQLEKAVELAPNDAVLLEHLAEILTKLGKKNEAVQTFRKSLQHAPTSDDKEVGGRVEKRLRELE